MLVAARTSWDRVLSAFIGITTLLMTVLLVRNFFGIAFGVLFGSAMIVLGAWLNERLNDVVLRIIGLTSCLYAVLDIKSDVLDRPGAPSDARMLAELTYIPTLVWGLVWMALAILGAAAFLYASSPGGRSRFKTRRT
jgi:hypothetical protein